MGVGRRVGGAAVEGARYSTGADRPSCSTGWASPDLDAVRKASFYFAKRPAWNRRIFSRRPSSAPWSRGSCKVGVDVVAFICGIMKSIASDGAAGAEEDSGEGHRRAVSRSRPVGIELAFVADYESLGALKADSLSPQDEALSAVFHSRELEKIMACISDDDDLLLLAMGIHDGMSGKALEEFALDGHEGVSPPSGRSSAGGPRRAIRRGHRYELRQVAQRRREVCRCSMTSSSKLCWPDRADHVPDAESTRGG